MLIRLFDLTNMGAKERLDKVLVLRYFSSLLEVMVTCPFHSYLKDSPKLTHPTHLFSETK